MSFCGKQVLFGQITNYGSLREICLCLEAHEKILYHLGFRNTVTHTSLSRANEKRKAEIFEEFGQYMISLVRPMYAGTPVADITVDNVLYALDSTTISTSIKLAAWALGKYSRGAVKMHTLLDLRGSIPANIHITNGKWHDSNELDELTPEKGAIYMMDKAYVDFEALHRFHQAEAFWVSRAKSNMRYEVVERHPVASPSEGVEDDMTIRLTGPKSSKLYPDSFRLVKYHDAETDNDIEFISNLMEVSALEIANLYRHRWDIEVFFKWIKQNVVVKTLWGFSENAVRTHLWVAVIAYLLMARIKADCHSPYSITEVAALIRVSALEKVFIRDLLKAPDVSISINQNVNELSLFNDI